MNLRTILLAATLVCNSSFAIGDCVVLLHGLARTSSSMVDLESLLTANNYRVINVDYPSRDYSIEELAPEVIPGALQRCATTADERVHFVTHSMGGILVRYYLANNEIENLGHVVMIAPPNQGSEVVDNLAGIPGFSLLNGPAGSQLGTDAGSIPSKLGPVNFSVGIIAGSKTFNPILSQYLPNPDDGKVSVESTKVEGMTDFVLVDASHPFIMQDQIAIEQTISFLKSGAFDPDLP